MNMYIFYLVMCCAIRAVENIDNSRCVAEIGFHYARIHPMSSITVARNQIFLFHRQHSVNPFNEIRHVRVIAWWVTHFFQTKLFPERGLCKLHRYSKSVPFEYESLIILNDPSWILFAQAYIICVA